MAVFVPAKGNPPAITGRVMVDTFRGRVRVRSWPRPRGKIKNPLIQQQVDWFKDATKIIKLVPGSQMSIAIDATKGSGLYPRDLLMKAMSGGLYDLQTPDGQIITYRRYEVQRVMFNGTACREPVAQSVGAGANLTLEWGLPALNPAGMWSAANPTRLTVPSGVEVITLTAGAVAENPVNGYWRVSIDKSDGTRVATVLENISGRPALVASTGPIKVDPLDWFEVNVFSTDATPIDTDTGTFFSAHIIGTS